MTLIQKHSTLYIPLILSLFFYTSCTEDASINPHIENVPVANCLLVNDSIQHLSLTRSGNIPNYKNFEKITDAQASLLENDSLVGNFTYKENDWQLRFTPQAGKHYSLKVVLSDHTVLTAQTTMPDMPPVSCLSPDTLPYRRYFLQTNHSCPLWAYVITGSTKLKTPANGRMVDELGSNHPDTDNFNEESDDMGEDYPGCASMVHDYYLRFASSERKETNFFIEAHYSSYSAVIFIAPSTEYDKYLKTSVSKMLVHDDDGDPESWFDETIVYSNINNGKGIFGAYNQIVFYRNGGEDEN